MSRIKFKIDHKGDPEYPEILSHQVFACMLFPEDDGRRRLYLPHVLASQMKKAGHWSKKATSVFPNFEQLMFEACAAELPKWMEEQFARGIVTGHVCWNYLGLIGESSRKASLSEAARRVRHTIKEDGASLPSSEILRYDPPKFPGIFWPMAKVAHWWTALLIEDEDEQPLLFNDVGYFLAIGEEILEILSGHKSTGPGNARRVSLDDAYRPFKEFLLPSLNDEQRRDRWSATPAAPSG